MSALSAAEGSDIQKRDATSHRTGDGRAAWSRMAMLRHKEAGLPVVIYRDGKAVWVMPEDLGF
jgi:hypothetical protein